MQVLSEVPSVSAIQIKVVSHKMMRIRCSLQLQQTASSGDGKPETQACAPFLLPYFKAAGTLLRRRGAAEWR